MLPCFQLFNSEWHKLMFAVRNDEVDMYLDCSLVSSKPLLPRGRIAINGDIVLGKTVPMGDTARVSAGIL